MFIQVFKLKAILTFYGIYIDMVDAQLFDLFLILLNILHIHLFYPVKHPLFFILKNKQLN